MEQEGTFIEILQEVAGIFRTIKEELSNIDDSMPIIRR